MENLNGIIKARIASCYDLEKGGEGSKGGKVIGHTTSGKPVYQKTHEWSHGLKVGDTVYHEKKAKKIREVSGNLIHFHGENEPVHISKVYDKQGNSYAKDIEKMDTGSTPGFETVTENGKLVK